MSNVFERLEEEVPRLRRYARALCRYTDHADDLVQESLLRAVERLHLWQPGTNLRAWLFTIMHNQYVNNVRRGVRRGTAVEFTDGYSQLGYPPTQVKRHELRDLERALAQLPDEQRMVVLMIALEGMKYEEVAAVLEVPIGTIRSRLSRGRDNLRRLIGDIPDESESTAADGHTMPWPVDP